MRGEEGGNRNRGTKLYQNLRIFTMDPNHTFLPNGWMLIRDGKIVSLGDGEAAPGDLSLQIEKVIDGEGRIALPGMCTTHAHFYGCFARGMRLPQAYHNWQQMLSRMWWKFDQKLTPRQIYYSALMGLVEGLKSGTTTYFDHQASPFEAEGSLDIIERAVREVGARACLSFETSDRNGEECAKRGIAENVRFIRKVQKRRDHQIGALFGLHAGYSVGKKTLEQCAALGEELDVGFHIHAAEDRADVSESYRLFDMHVVNRLEREGIFDRPGIAAHAVQVGSAQWKIFSRHPVYVAHNIQSNLNNAVGVSPVLRMMEAGVRSTLGGDGVTYDLFRELSMAVASQRMKECEPSAFSGEQIRKFTFESPGELSEQTLGIRTGVLQEGAAADFLILSYDEPTPMDGENVFSHLLSAFSGQVRDVIVSGEEVVKNGRCLHLDEEEIMAHCREEAAALWASL